MDEKTVTIMRFRKRRAARLALRGKTDRMDAANWKENDHPRSKDGKFTSGSGSNSGPSKTASKAPAKKAKTSAAAKHTATALQSRLPKPKTGTEYSPATIKALEGIAERANKNPDYEKRMNKVLSSLTDKDIIKQKGEDGKDVTCIPGLSYKIEPELQGCSEEAKKLFERRIAGGEKLTSDMLDISSELGGSLRGLEYCYKTGESLGRKINTKIDEVKDTIDGELSDADILDSIDDAVRYTFMCDHDDIGDKCLAAEEALKKRGYTITSRDNKYQPKYDKNGKEVPRDYKGVHLQVMTPDGDLVELQIHSKESMEVKEMNHPIYEDARKLKKGSPERLALEKQMIDNTAKLSNPRGILDLPSFDAGEGKRRKAKAKIG